MTNNTPNNNPVQLTAPGKTFIAGEYLALVGGPSLILNTPPLFKLTVTHTGSNLSACQHPFHPLSPAGHYVKAHCTALMGLSLNFYDPYHKAGGFGASSAQFALLSQFIHPNFSIEEHIKQYQSIIKKNNRQPPFYQHYFPSGADVGAQIIGSPIALIDPATQTYKALQWPEDLSYCVIHTQKKVTTHSHLSDLDPLKETLILSLSKIMSESISHLNNGAIEAFCESVQCYGDTLISAQLSTEDTQRWIKLCATQPGVLAVKGCGALGADTLLVLLENKQLAPFKAWVANHGLAYLSSDGTLYKHPACA